MKRPNPIFLGLAIVSAVGLGLEVWAITRSRGEAHATSEPPDPAPELEPATPPSVPPVASAPPPPPAPSAPAAIPAPALPPAALNRPTFGPYKRPLFVAPNVETVRQDADEMAFAALRLADETRAAIRRINENHAAQVNALRNGAAVNESAPDENDPSVKTRRAALRELLGFETAERFEAAEQSAAKRLHNRYRWQSLHGVVPGTTDRPSPPQQTP